MRGSLAVGLVAAIGWAAAMPSARAAEPDPPLVVMYAAPELGDAASAARAALAGAAQRLGSALVDLSPPAEAPAEAALHLRRAVEAYQDFRYAEALASADAGLSEASATGASGLSVADLSDLLIYRALALTERGDAARAWDDFVRAATLDPTRRLDPVRYTPRVIETFGRAVKAVTAAPPASLTVDLPAECELWLDGRAITGQRSLSTTRGEHYLRARCPGRAAFGALVLVAGAQHRVAPALPPLAPPGAPQIRASAAQRGFRSAVSATLTRGRRGGAALLLTLRWVPAPGQPDRRSVVLELDRPDRTAGIEPALQRLIAPAVAVGSRPAARERPTPWYRRPWLWGLAGAAIGAAVLIPFAIDSPSPSDYDVRPGGDLPP